MALPIREVSYTTRMVGDKPVDISGWTTRDEKNYLIAKEIQDNMSENTLFECLLKPCMRNPELFDDMSVNEKRILMIEIRSISVGDTFTTRYSCSECKQVNEDTVSIKGCVDYTPTSFNDITINDFTYIIKPNYSKHANDILQAIKSPTERLFKELALSISEIKNGRKKHNNFTFEEMIEFLESTPVEEFDELVETYVTMKDSLTLKTELTCMFCGKKHPKHFARIPNFIMW